MTGDEMSGVAAVADELLDRLVDGEIDPRQRQELLKALDREPDGWRRCAMAFLEAQAWADAFDGGNEIATRVPAPAPRQRARLGFMRLGGIAAAVAVAFVTGFAARGPSGAGQTSAPYAINPPPTSPAPTAAPAAPVRPPPTALPAYVRRQLEREGYEVKGDQKLVSVALQDGRQVAVPVETLKYRFVGYRVH
jgi:hypothetical protein